MLRRTRISLALLLALAASVLFHLGALWVPELEFGVEPEESPPLEARLRVPIPAAAPVKQQVPATPPPKVVAPAPAASDPSPSAAAPALAAGAGPAPLPVPVVPPVPPLALPDKGGILYNVTLGPGGLRVGRAVHRWEFGEGRYRIYVMTETAGFAAFLKTARMEYESRGTLQPSGLQPEIFNAYRNGAEPGDSVVFDWAQQTVSLSRTGKSYPLTPGAQDFASFYYQLVVLAQIGDGLEFGVATARKFQPYRFDVIGEETVETEAGTFRTQHLRVQTDMILDLWLALDRQRLPVKIRYTDRKGDVLEQVATAFSDKSPL